MAIISIDYDGIDQSTYRGIELRLEGREDQTFATGDPSADHVAALKAYLTWLAVNGVQPDDGVLLGSSSMDHFVMDGTAWAYRQVELTDVPVAGTTELFECTIEALVPA